MNIRIMSIVLLLLVAGYVLAQGRSATTTGPVSTFSITNFPIFGAVAAQSDSVSFASPQVLRANAAGVVTATCWGNGPGTVAAGIAVTLAAGEEFPCQVIRLWDTGTDAITIHRFF